MNGLMSIARPLALHSGSSASDHDRHTARLPFAAQHCSYVLFTHMHSSFTFATFQSVATPWRLLETLPKSHRQVRTLVTHRRMRR